MSDSNRNHPSNGWPVSSEAEFTVEDGVVFPESIEAFQYPAEHVNAMARSLRQGMEVVLNLNRKPYTVCETDWVPETRERTVADIDVPYTTAHSTVEAGPVERCEFIAVLGRDSDKNEVVTVRVPPDRAAAPVWNAYRDSDLPKSTAVETMGLYTPIETGTVARLERVPPGEISAEISAQEYCDQQINTATHGPTVDEPIEELALSGPHERIQKGEVPALPNRFTAIDRCPLCSSAVVKDNKKDRVVCVDCRRWCSFREWTRYHKSPRDELTSNES